jgi:hypothetical protein
VVISVTVKEPFNKPASFKPQLHYLLVMDTRTRDKLVSEVPNTLQYYGELVLWMDGRSEISQLMCKLVS